MALNLKAYVEHNGCRGIMGTYSMFNMSQKSTENVAIKGITRVQALYAAHGYTWIHMILARHPGVQNSFLFNVLLRYKVKEC